MSWFGNCAQDRDLLDIVLGMAEDPSIPVETTGWTRTMRHRGHVSHEPQLIHKMGGVVVRRPSPTFMNFGPWNVVVEGHSIVPSRMWRSKYASAFVRRERVVAARAFTASIETMRSARPKFSSATKRLTS